MDYLVYNNHVPVAQQLWRDYPREWKLGPQNQLGLDFN